MFVCVKCFLLPYLCIHVGMFMCGCGCVMHGPVEKSDCFIPALYVLWGPGLCLWAAVWMA